MTKVRAPLTVGQALDRIAGLLPGSWAEMAAICGIEDAHTVRAWGDPDKADRQLWFDRAIALDIAYQRAGGEDRPLFDTYKVQLDLARAVAFSSEIAIARRACVMIRETSQAHEAMVLATLPSATELDREHAVRELEDVVREGIGSIALLRGPREPPPDTS
jgi:hypothetical protein